jgi:hypothetical protein
VRIVPRPQDLFVPDGKATGGIDPREALTQARTGPLEAVPGQPVAPPPARSAGMAMTAESVAGTGIGTVSGPVCGSRP